eukprot:281542-Hanusia_phi.AAC.1
MQIKWRDSDRAIRQYAGGGVEAGARLPVPFAFLSGPRGGADAEARRFAGKRDEGVWNQAGGTVTARDQRGVRGKVARGEGGGRGCPAVEWSERRSDNGEIDRPDLHIKAACLSFFRACSDISEEVGTVTLQR